MGFGATGEPLSCHVPHSQRESSMHQTNPRRFRLELLGLAIVIAVYRHRETVDITQVNLMRR